MDIFVYLFLVCFYKLPSGLVALKITSK